MAIVETANDARRMHAEFVVARRPMAVACRCVPLFFAVVLATSAILPQAFGQGRERPADPRSGLTLQLESPTERRSSSELPPPAEGRIKSQTAATAGPRVPLSEALIRRGDLMLRDSTLNSALFTISELWKINIVAPQVDGQVNGVFQDAPLREILDSILISNGYGYRAVGESLVVSRLSELGQVNPFFESATIPVRSMKVEEVVAGAELLKTPAGQVKAIPSASSLFVVDYPDRVKMIRDFVTSIDETARLQRGGAAPVVGPQRLEVAYMKTQYVAARNVEPAITSVLSPMGRVAVMEDEDRLLIVDSAENLAMARAVLERVDRPLPQVTIRALIYDISLQDLEELGINWQSLSGSPLGGTLSAGGGIESTGTAASGSGVFANSVTKAPFSEQGTGGAFTFFTLNQNFSLAAVALALQQAADSRLLADPNVTVLDNQQATIESVQEIPFQQLTQTAAGGNIGTTAFKEAGITLDVTPKIAADGTIEMIVRPEFSRLTGFTPGDNQPIIDRRSAETRVRIRNGQTFVIGGLRQRSDVGEFNGIPFLKDWRLVGRLFRARETTVRESELVVFITPTIVGCDPPLTPRERCVAETVDWRLAQIPGAEGRPPFACEAPCIDGPCMDAPCTDSPCDDPVTPIYGPQPSPPVHEATPTQATTTAPAPAQSEASAYSTVTQPANVSAISRGIRRLPATYPNAGGLQIEVAQRSNLRRSYDDRFRSRTPAAKPADGQAPEEPKKPAPSWRTLWR